MWKCLVVTLAMMWIVGCSSTQTSPELEYPLVNIYSAIENVLSMGIQHTSANQREFTSRPFVVKQDPALKKAGLHERGIARVVVLGDSRPYTIEVVVSIERGKIQTAKNKEPAEFSQDHYDKILAKRLLDKILGVLDRRQHDDNIIDDFKSF